MKIIVIAIKDLTRFARSLFLIGMTLVAPLAIAGLMYFALGGLSSGEASLATMYVGVVNADALPDDAPLEAPVGQSIRDMFFDESVKTWIVAADYPDEAAAREALDAQAIGVAVIIPPGFTADTLAGRAGEPVLILQDPTLTIGPTVARDMVTSLLDGLAGGGIAFRVVSARLEANGQAPDPAQFSALFERYAAWYADLQRALFHSPQTAALVIVSPATGAQASNTVQNMLGLIMAGQLAFFSFFTGAYAMQSILQEDEEGTLARLFTTPTNRTTILAGKFLAVFLTVLFQGLVLLIVTRLAFQVEWGQPVSVALGLAGQMFASVGLAALLIAFVKNSRQAGPVLGAVLTGLGALSGLFTANIDMPAAFDALGNFTPQGWVLKIWKLCLAGQPPVEVLLPFAVLVIMGVVMFGLGAALFRRRYA